MRRIQLVTTLVGLASIPILFSNTVRAHCPLCSAGAGGAAALASALGIGLAVVGVFVGAFGVATGLLTARYLEGQYLSYQDQLVALGVALAIVLPVLPLMNETVPVYLSLVGEYGTMFNRVYLVNTYLVGVVVGTVVTYSMPAVSGWLSELRGSTVPFQGFTLTFLSLALSALLLEVFL